MADRGVRRLLWALLLACSMGLAQAAGHGRSKDLDAGLADSLADFDRFLQQQADTLAEASGADAKARESTVKSTADGSGSKARPRDQTAADTVKQGEAQGPARWLSDGNSEQVDDADSGETGMRSEDDAIARQLRSAAVSESDPSRRERLWQLYRDYRAAMETDGSP